MADPADCTAVLLLCYTPVEQMANTASGVVPELSFTRAGGHLNPAITLGNLIARKITAQRALFYWGAQVILTVRARADGCGCHPGPCSLAALQQPMLAYTLTAEGCICCSRAREHRCVAAGSGGVRVRWRSELALCDAAQICHCSHGWCLYICLTAS